MHVHPLCSMFTVDKYTEYSQVDIITRKYLLVLIFMILIHYTHINITVYV